MVWPGGHGEPTHRPAGPIQSGIAAAHQSSRRCLGGRVGERGDVFGPGETGDLLGAALWPAIRLRHGLGRTGRIYRPVAVCEGREVPVEGANGGCLQRGVQAGAGAASGMMTEGAPKALWAFPVDRFDGDVGRVGRRGRRAGWRRGEPGRRPWERGGDQAGISMSIWAFDSNLLMTWSRRSMASMGLWPARPRRIL